MSPSDYFAFLAPALIGLASLALSFYIWRQMGPPRYYAMPLISLGVIAWSLGDALNSLKPGLLADWWVSLGMDLLPIASLAVAVQITQERQALSRRLQFFLIGALLAGQVFFWLSFPYIPNRESIAPKTAVTLDTLSSWLATILRLGALTGATFVLVRRMPRRPAALRWRSMYLLSGALVVWSVYAIEAAGLKSMPYLDLSPVLFTLGQAVLAFSGLRPSLQDMLPLARDALIENMPDAVFVLDSKQRIVDLNPAALKIITAQSGKEIAQNALDRSLRHALPSLAARITPGRASASPFEIAFGSGESRRDFEAYTTLLTSTMGSTAGYLVQLRETTSRRQAEAARQELADQLAGQLRLLDSILATTPDYFIIHDEDGRFLYASPTTLKALGISSDQATGKTWRELNLPSEAGDIYERHLAMVFNTGLTETFEIEIPGPETSRHFEIILNAFQETEGQDELTISTVREVSDRYTMEEALRAKEERYRTVVDSLEEGIVIHDGTGRVVACNPSAERILGLAVDRGMGKILSDTNRLTIHEDGSPFPNEHHPAMLALSTGEAQSEVVMGIQTPAKTLTWVLVNAQPLFKPNADKPYGVVSSYADITANKLAESALRDSQYKLEALLEFAPVAIVIVNEQGCIQRVNHKAEEIFGYTRQEMVGQTVELLIPEQFQTNHDRLRRRYMQAPEARSMGKDLKLFARRKDGSTFPVDIGLNTIQTGEGKLVMSYLIDVTERQNQEEALRQANEKLVHSLSELEVHNRELTLLNEMGDMLQSCASLDEAYDVVAEFARQLFPGHSGELYQLNPERNQVEAVTSWGNLPIEEMEFSPQACWALRRGRLHSIASPGDGLICSHVQTALETVPPYLCIPMLAQGEVKGIFHLRSDVSPHDQHGHEQLAVTVAEHISMSLANIKLRETLRLLSVRDPLTGLYNRRYLEEALEREMHLARRYQRCLGVIMLDIDHFKQVNDNYGHAAGDAMLRALANFIIRTLRTEDIACRYGGEEFTIILPDTCLENSQRVAEKLWKGVRNLQAEYMGQSLVSITASFGVASYRGEPQTSRALLDEADQALYRAKQSGRDRVVVADAE
ncbi:MAG: diguanylate cyclase [Chloroflexota bacterium]